jgi:hypothetical protein
MAKSTINDGLKFGATAMVAGAAAVLLESLLSPHDTGHDYGDKSKKTPSPDRRSRRSDDGSESRVSGGSGRNRDRSLPRSDKGSESRRHDKSPQNRDRRSRTSDGLSSRYDGRLPYRSHHSDTSSDPRNREPPYSLVSISSQRDGVSPFPRTEIDFGDEQDDPGFTSEEDIFITRDDSSDDGFSLDEDPTPFPVKIYDPLQGNRYIRVIKLHRGAEPDPLHCSLFQMHLEDSDPFEAISYVWGEEHPRLLRSV